MDHSNFWTLSVLPLALILIVLLSHSVIITSGEGIDCFKCVSINGSNPACEDPFHNNYTLDLLERPCLGGRKGRNGLFPASSCIKLTGTYSDGGGSITIRGCALDSGTLTTDTEIIRMSHCGSFYFDERHVHGCVQSCDDVDACNSAPIPGVNAHLLRIFPFLIWPAFLHTIRLSHRF